MNLDSKKVTADVLLQAAFLLREVADGRCTSSAFFFNVTLATEALKDGDIERANIFLGQAEQFDSATYQKAIASGSKYLIVWGAGEQEQGRQECLGLAGVRGMLQHDTDLTPEGIESLIKTGRSDDRDTDPTACTQFDYAWIRLERIGQ